VPSSSRHTTRSALQRPARHLPVVFVGRARLHAARRAGRAHLARP
jgi:hypothetical protein